MKIRFNAVRLTVVFALILFASRAFGQLSKVHYIPPISISEESGNNSPFEQWIYISTPNNSNVQYVIKPLGGGGDIVGLVSNSNPAKHSTRTSNNDYDTQFVVPNSSTGTVLTNRGYVIEADQPIYISVRLASSAQAGALVSKGNDALGQNFLLGSFANVLSNSSNDSGLANFFSMLATEDNTTIQVQFPNTVVLENYSGTYPLTVTLNKNESYVGLLDVSEALGNRNGLLGAQITSDKPIAVNTGSAAGTNGPGSPRDFGIDQIVDTRFAGKEYIFIRGVGDDSWENVMIVPKESNTSIKINGGTPISITGAYYEIDGSLYDTNGNMFVESDKPVVAYQGIGGAASQANQGMFFVPPLSCSSRGNVDNIPLINEIGSSDLNGSSWFGAIGIVAKTGVEVLVNESALTSGTIVSANNAYTTYLINNLQDGTYSIKSNDELYVSYYNYSGPATSGSFYSGFVSNPILQNNMTVTALGTCVKGDGTSNTTFTTSSGYDSYEWQKYNDTVGSFEPASGTNNQSVYEPTLPGQYRLLGKLSCFPTKEYISDVITVSVCPDDYDSDGIPDTIDLDRDNDGILNMFESLGNGTIDFSSPLSPSITLPNNPASVITSTASYAPTSASISGDPNGKITSAIPFSGLNEKTSYSLNPILPTNQPLNIRLSEVAGSTINEFETITLSIYPTTENISLLDPGQKLLVDNGTGFKRVAQEGVSGNRIKFKYNPSPLDASKAFEILGVNISGVEIIHELNALATSNVQFNIQMEIVDYEVDSDVDGTIDAFDDDSDDDDCIDMVEAGHEVLTSVGAVMYDPTDPNSKIDQRGRFVFSGYDFNQTPTDGDSNGIYDFQEVGTPATLSEDFVAASAVLCEGETLTLSIKTPDSDTVLWEVDTDQDGVFEAADALATISNDTDSYVFQIDNVPVSLDQAVFRARLSKSTYACTTDTQLFTLTVNTNTTKPTLEPLIVVCKDATVANLAVPDVVWYEAVTGGNPLPETTLLKHNTTYYAASVVNGCVGSLRSETKVVVNDPVISTVSGKTTFCADEAVTLTLDTDKILPSPDDFARINNLIYIENAQGPVQYDNGFYYTQNDIKTGVQPITWPNAKSFGESIVGATMYIINSTAEEDAVYEGLQHMELTGNDGIAFWLGLFQDKTASDYSEPAGGWYWVDGTPLSYENWWNSEPNDWPSDSTDGEEDYAQFEFGNNGVQWNDMGLTQPEGQSYPLFEYKAQTSIQWFVDDGTAITPISGAANSSQLVVNPTQTTTYYVRVITNGVTCDSDPFTVTINPLPQANEVPGKQIEICSNDNNGAIASADLRGAFDLTSTYTSVIGTQDANTHAVTFYTSQVGAENEISAAEITTPNSFTSTSNPQDIYYRVTNTDTGCVSDVKILTLLANSLPPTLTIPDVVACDNLDSGSDEDGILRFNLKAQTGTIQSLLSNPGQYAISYHETLADAEVPTNAISEYTTKMSDNRAKTIIVRLEDKTTGCYRTDITLNLVVAELPVIKESTFVREQCDTDSDGSVQDNLTLYNDVFSDNHQNETFTYYTDASHINQITDPTTFMNTSMNQTVYVKITNPDTGCERTYDPATNDPLTIDIIVRASNINSSFLETYYTCLEQTNTTNNGISTFDKNVFTNLEAKLIAEHPAFGNNNVSIQFFESESDAASKLNPINTTQDYINTTPDTQEIWAAVDAVGFTDISCLGLKQVANFIVEPLAILHPVTIPRQCDGDSPLDLDSEDGKFPFDTSTVLDQLLLTQNPADYKIVFYDENDNVISTDNFPAIYESPSQMIRVEVANTPSKVSPPCYQETFITFTVDDSPKVGAYTMAAQCDDNDGALDGMATFDTSNLNAELLAGQANMEINYVQRDGSGNETDLGSNLPNPFDTETTTVIAQVYNPANMTCIMEEYIHFQVNENPVFELPEEQVFCQNLGFDTIYVTNPSATYTYSWTLNGTPITNQATQDLIITEGGTYTVTATNPVTGCNTAKVINVYASEIASFMPEDISVFDLTGDGSNRIEIKTSTLGIGDYEFALNGPPYLYQDSPIFEDVPPGIHTLSVRDKNGCGVVRHEVSVIGYAFYFTPNNDGKNDTWQVLGVSDTFQAQSLIYIFDRHGRLMAQIPANGDGWDGTYNGSPMPADDYWFRVKLEDGRSFTGHFSLIR